MRGIVTLISALHLGLLCFSIPVEEKCPNNTLQLCDNCTKGTYSDQRVYECRCCGSGQCLTGNCRACAVGFYQNNTQQLECLPCPNGFYQNLPMQAECIPCPQGHICNSTGCDSCVKCDPGASTNGIGKDQCILCEKGYYKGNLSDTCEPCKPGSYSLEFGTTECILCPEGSFCPCTTCPPQKCTEDAFCPPGVKQPIFCQSPFFTMQEHKCYISNVTYGMVAAVTLIFLLIVVIFVVKLVFLPRRRAFNESRALVQDPSIEPVYTGL